MNHTCVNLTIFVRWLLRAKENTPIPMIWIPTPQEHSPQPPTPQAEALGQVLLQVKNLTTYLPVILWCLVLEILLSSGSLTSILPTLRKLYRLHQQLQQKMEGLIGIGSESPLTTPGSISRHELKTISLPMEPTSKSTASVSNSNSLQSSQTKSTPPAPVKNSPNSQQQIHSVSSTKMKTTTFQEEM